jgi:predicted negative regulator of RcsB-dependent stress response
VALNAAEEETIESLKTWWNENGKQLLILVVVAFAGYSGWTLWQNSRTGEAAAASDLYEEVLSLSLTEQGQPIADADSERIVAIARQLKAEHSGSAYAMFASLFEAQQAVVVNDLDAAESALRWILDNQQSGLFGRTDEGLILTANLRLGRVLLAKGEAEAALSLVNATDPKQFEAGYAELRGDIYVAMGRLVDARDAYIVAQQAGSTSDGLRMKLDNLSGES